MIDGPLGAARALARCLRGPLLALGLLSGMPFAQAAGLDEGALGRWLDTEVVPGLAATLSRSPRFRGETLDFVALEAGVPQADSSILHDGVAAHLRQRLLAVDGLRFAVADRRAAYADCAVPPEIDLLIGIEIDAGAGRDARVSLAALDVHESLWVSGVTYAWRGRLSGAERQALATAVSNAAPGSAARPLPALDAAPVAAALQAALACALPAGIDGTTHVDGGEQGLDARVALALRGALTASPLLVLTPDRGAARWHLQVTSGGSALAASAGLREVRLLLTDAQGGGVQQVASVFVTGAGEAGPPPSPPPAVVAAPAVVQPAPAQGVAPQPPVELLGGVRLRQVEPTGICDDPWGRVAACAEVSVDLTAPAWLFVLSTRDGRASLLGCASRPQRSAKGERRYRFEVEDLRDGGLFAPDAGVYVLAVADGDIARELAAVLRSAPGACEAPAVAPTGAWLAGLDAVLTRHRGRIDWRALHLARDGAHVVRI
ncbi:MAG TPA: hypothetical protein VLA56_03790 [Pseudomonadales bacterium]|nr:hypothetical protein [Pseudomonadales bacterium]